MILAEVKSKDNEAFTIRLFNCSLKLFQAIANKRYVAVGRIHEFSDLPAMLAKHLGWGEPKQYG